MKKETPEEFNLNSRIKNSLIQEIIKLVEKSIEGELKGLTGNEDHYIYSLTFLSLCEKEIPELIGIKNKLTVEI